MKRMKVIGMTGGVGAGKSTVLSYLSQRYHAHLILADEVGHRLMEVGQALYLAERAEYGDSILNEDGSINRARLAEIAFANEENRIRLNEMAHPLIKQAILEELRQQRECGTQMVVLEAAILAEGGLDACCDEIWFVYTDSSVRITRLMSSRGYSRQKAEAILRSQPSDEEYSRMSQHIIDNGGSVEEMQRQVDALLRGIGMDNK